MVLLPCYVSKTSKDIGETYCFDVDLTSGTVIYGGDVVKYEASRSNSELRRGLNSVETTSELDFVEVAQIGFADRDFQQYSLEPPVYEPACFVGREVRRSHDYFVELRVFRNR